MTKEFTVNYNSMLTDILEKPATISTCFNTFHNYSINNQFLAYWQLKCRELPISPIASFGQWNKLNRHVKAGESGLYLWMPLQIKEKDDDGNEIGTKTIFKFKKGWFALSQTQGAELKALDTLKIKYIEFNKLNGNLQGYARTDEDTISINPLAEDYEMTTFHEMAHIVLKHKKAEYSKELKELEAEATAYIIGSIIGLSENELSRSRGYVQSWFKDSVIPEKNAKNIMSAAQKILKAGLEKEGE